MSFDNPAVFFLLLLHAIFIPVAIVHYFKSREGIAVFAAASSGEERKSLLRELRFRLIISDVLFLFFTVFLIIALAGPRWGVRIVADYRRSVDVILAFDCSRSMDVSDCPPSIRTGTGLQGQGNMSRLERGVEIATYFAAGMADIRMGAVIGKGRGVLAVPLTYDSETILNFLDSLDGGAVTGAGTNLESLVNVAIGSFQDSMPVRRLIVLFSDGESLSGSFQAAVDKARRAGITLCAVGLGSDHGGPVPLETDRTGFLLSADGKAVISARQEDVLQNASDRTGGLYVDGSRNDAALALSNFINSIASESRLSGHRREAKARWQIFIIAAIVCLAGARFMGFSRRYPRRGSFFKNRKMLAGLLFLMLFTSCARSQGKLLVMEGNFFNSRGFYAEAISSYLKALEYDDAAPYAEYGLGSAYFALDEGGAALERYKAAERGLLELDRKDHQELKYRIQYNAGIIHFEKGDFDEAAGAFRNALKIDGSRIEAKRNLELSLLTIERKASPQAASSEGRSEDALEGASRSSSILFEYLRKREQEQWASREWSGEGESTGPDY